MSLDKPINKKLVKGYARLLKKDTEKISVSLLCEMSDVSRASFYLYYKSLKDFEDRLGAYMMNKFFEQATYFLRCSDEELENALKKENLFFDKYEKLILKHMISGSNYLDFATFANSYYLNEKESSLFSGEVWDKHKQDIDFFSRGYLMLLILGMTGYTENTFEKDIKKCRALFRQLCKEIIIFPD